MSYYLVKLIPCEGDIKMGVVEREELYESEFLAKQIGVNWKNYKEGRDFQVWSFTPTDFILTT